MTRYITPAEAVSEYLLDEGFVTLGSHFTTYMPDWTQLASNVRIVTQIADVSIVPLPKYLRDTCTLQFNIRGRNKQDIDDALTKGWEIYNALFSGNSFEKNGWVYFRFLSNSAPNVVGMYDASEPFVSFSISLMRDGLSPEGNRIVIE